MEVPVKLEYQGEKKEKFQRQMIDTVCKDAVKQRSNLVLILPERKTITETVLISKFKKRLLLEKSWLLCCLFEHLRIHD